ncbi:MAG: citrate (Re)-synthase [Candidatus Atribacteria bacterium]|nr:citrate (Re)-synthase [Candidatus Atribacteria bacterium]
MAKVYLLDVTNRDGVQTAHLGLAKIEKTMVNFYLNEMGVRQSEFGFPTTHHETNYLNANLELAEIGALSPIRLSGWMRAVKQDVELAYQLVPKLQYLNLSISTSRQMIQGKFQGKMSKDDITKAMVEATKTAKELGAQEIGVNAEDASRTEIEYLIEFALAAKEAGAERFRYCDTLGYDSPFTTYERIARIGEKVKMPLELHCHNDLGMAVANSISGAKAAVDVGCDVYINTTINGVGERAGNADLVSVILGMKYASGMDGKKYQLDERINLKAAWKTCKYTSYAFKVPIPITQPGVGANAFAHASGIHADGVLKDRKNYELYDFEELGRGEPELVETGRQIVVGEYSGIKGFRNVYENLEVEFKNEEEAREILELARFANVEKQKPITEDELLFIARYPKQAKKILTLIP